MELRRKKILTFAVLALRLSVEGVKFRSQYMQRKTTNRSPYSAYFQNLKSNVCCDTKIEPEQNLHFSGVREENFLDESYDSGNAKEMGRSRRKRAVFAWPPDSIFQAQFSIEMPLPVPDGTGIPFLLEVPFAFILPNVTENIITARSSKEERSSFFKTTESFFHRLGFNGRECMLKAICERAETDVVHQGLIGEVLNLVLTRFRFLREKLGLGWKGSLRRRRIPWFWRTIRKQSIMEELWAIVARNIPVVPYPYFTLWTSTDYEHYYS